MNDRNDVPAPAGGATRRERQDPLVVALRASITAPFVVVDHRLLVRGWNLAATHLLEVDVGPENPNQHQGGFERRGLVRLLAAATRLDAPTRQAILAATRAAVQQDASPDTPGPLGLQLRRVGTHRWMLLFTPAVSEPAASLIPAGATANTADQAETTLIDLALTDPLTSLPNRRAFQDALSCLTPQMAGSTGGPAVLLIDLDRFKLVNDRLGHPVGDALLVAVGQRLRAALRGSDRVFRLGGDEFAVIVTTPDRAETVATRLIELMSRTYLIQGHVCIIGASIGIASAPGDGTTGDDLVRCADLALYQAKADGRQCVRLFRPELDTKARERYSLEADLRLAVVRNQLELHYQAQIDVATGQLAGFEALLRWRHPERGLVPPDAFIAIAEELGLIVPFGEWVLRTACRDCAHWSVPLSIAVNVSPMQLDPAARLVEAVQSALAQSGLPANRLEIEITESALLREQDATRAILNTLRDMGVRISMDDFGTGYSSLSQLRSFPFDKIKIDRSFINDLSNSHEATAVVRAVTALGNSLGMTTTAEGVETIEQANTLGAEGCTYMQGFLISRPLPLEQIDALIARHVAETPPTTPPQRPVAAETEP